MQIGNKIRYFREKKNMTLTELAEKSGVQIATLSRMENQKMTGTLESHLNIARALNIEITELYQGIAKNDSAAEPITDLSTAESFTYNDKASYEILTNNVLSKKMMPIILRIEAGGKTKTEKNNQGTEKFLFVLEGKISVRIENKSFTLSRNNALYLDSALEHHIVNSGDTVAKIISVTTPAAL